ncbi:hypothetical protein Bbelb_392330 [Branchiostoma belcheri]|nr:hypothetical protein Bbelb_392330 [Branchiostoma belcheri]
MADDKNSGENTQKGSQVQGIKSSGPGSPEKRSTNSKKGSTAQGRRSHTHTVSAIMASIPERGSFQLRGTWNQNKGTSDANTITIYARGPVTFVVGRRGILKQTVPEPGANKDRQLNSACTTIPSPQSGRTPECDYCAKPYGEFETKPMTFISKN